VHDFPASSSDVPDDADARLVILGVEYPYTKDSDSPAVAAAKAILEARGSSPRLLKNTLAFLAADKTKLSDLDEAVRRYLAWQSIVDETQELNLDPQQQKNAKTQLDNADKTVNSRLPSVTSGCSRRPKRSRRTLSNGRHSASPARSRSPPGEPKDEDGRAAHREPCRDASRLELDNVPLWRGDHVAIKTLIETLPDIPTCRACATAASSSTPSPKASAC